MSFFVNNVELNEATFNQQEVKSIYFNTHLIWEAPGWPGWANATWEDIYKLCQQRWNGSISWPDDVVLGATKETTLSTAILGTSTFTMRIIGLDIESQGVITFDSKYLTAETMTISSLDTYQYDFYKYCDAKPYIKPLRKGTAAPDINRNGNVIYDDYYVWSLSEREVNLDQYSGISVANSTTSRAECTSGINKPYPFFNSNERRIKTIAGSSIGYNWLTRSEGITSLTGRIRVYIKKDGISNACSESYSDMRFSPCFAIG